MREEIKKAIEGIHPKKIDPRVVYLEGMGIKDEDLEEIAQYIIKIRSDVKQIILRNNYITDEGAKILAKALAPLVGVGKKLELLSLSHTPIGEEGFRTLCDGLVTLNPDFWISIHACKLRDPVICYDIQQAAIRTYHDNQAKKKVESCQSYQPSTSPKAEQVTPQVPA